MSGTSADGVDVAITAIDGRGLAMTARLVRHHHLAYSDEVRGRIGRIRAGGAVPLGELAEAGRAISLAYAQAVQGACGLEGIAPSSLAAVAAHGQTLYHAPPDTIQWLDPALIAARLDCPVISDFRRADCAAGGQGAPLVPFADYLLFRHPDRHRVLLNIGGIANLTWLPAGGSIDEVIAFDTGPGNCISDWLCRTFDPQGPGYDAGGAKALRGEPGRALIDWLMSQPYFRNPPPKSTDGPGMIALWEAAPVGVRPHPGRGAEADARALDDALATAALWTGRSIQDAMARFLPARPDEVIISGGGVENQAIVHHLKVEFSTVRQADHGSTQFYEMSQFGMPAAAKEAVAFALLGAATLDGEPSNVPSATGASRRVVLGSITPRP